MAPRSWPSLPSPKRGQLPAFSFGNMVRKPTPSSLLSPDLMAGKGVSRAVLMGEKETEALRVH